MPRHALRGRVRAVRGAEGVVDVQVAELGERASEALVVRLLSSEEARVLEKKDLARLELRRGLHRLVGVGAFHELDARLRERLEVPRDGLERVLGLGLPFRPAEVGEKHHARAVIEQIVDGGKRGADARVIAHAAVLVHRNVEVHAHERALAAQLGVGEVANGFLVHLLCCCRW